MKLKALRLFLTACVFLVCGLAGHSAWSCPTGEAVLKQIPILRATHHVRANVVASEISLAVIIPANIRSLSPLIKSLAEVT
jgi:hypothetical protein